MNEFVIAFWIGIAIAAVWTVFRLLVYFGDCTSKEDVSKRFDEMFEENHKKREAYWNGGMTRRDWFWWGRW